MSKRWRRRNYFIKKDLQGKYIFSFFILVIAGSIAFTAILSLLSTDTLTVVYKNHNLRIGKTPSVLVGEIFRAYWIFILSAGVIVVIISMFLTHRFAGPLFRFERSLDEMIRGNLSLEIRLRKRDEGKELARMINKFNDELSSRIKEMREISDRIDGSLSEASQVTPEGGDSIAPLNRGRELNRRLKEILQSYAIKNE